MLVDDSLSRQGGPVQRVPHPSMALVILVSGNLWSDQPDAPRMTGATLSTEKYYAISFRM